MLEVEINSDKAPSSSINTYVHSMETPSQDVPTPTRRGRRSRSEVRLRGGGLEAVRQGSLSRFVGKHEREKRDKIERENQILLRKILDCHHGVDRDRTSVIPSPAEGQRNRRQEPRKTPQHLRTSNQINSKRVKQKTDYENLLLLQKIQNVKPSCSVRKAFC